MSHRTRRTVHPGLQQIHDLLYLDIVADREVYNPEKEWNVEMLSTIAEIVADYVPRPTQRIHFPGDDPPQAGPHPGSSAPGQPAVPSRNPR
ncbi:MAG: hypothetical protein ACOC93_00025 [Planctomycetota bacterium]